MKRSYRWHFGLGCLLVFLLVGAYLAVEWILPNLGRSRRVWLYLQNPSAFPDWRVKMGERCGEAPFSMPTDGYVGFLWGDSFRLGHRHQGIDIFAGTEPGVTEVRVAIPAT